MLFRAFLSTLVIAAFSVAAPAEPSCTDKRCRVEWLLKRPAGIALDKKLSLARLKKLAHIVSDRSEVRPNPNYPGENDEIHSIAFDGLCLHATVTPEKAVLVDWVELTGKKFALPFGLKLGLLENPKEVQAVMGEPDRVGRGTLRNAQQLIYYNQERTESVTFVLRGGALKAIIWNYGIAD